MRKSTNNGKGTMVFLMIKAGLSRLLWWLGKVFTMLKHGADFGTRCNNILRNKISTRIYPGEKNIRN